MCELCQRKFSRPTGLQISGSYTRVRSHTDFPNLALLEAHNRTSHPDPLQTKQAEVLIQGRRCHKILPRPEGGERDLSTSPALPKQGEPPTQQAAPGQVLYWGYN